MTNLFRFSQIIETFIADVYTERGSDPKSIPVDWIWAITVSIFAIGGMAGGFSGGLVANRFGR